MLGYGGNGSLPGAQMESVPCGGSDSAVLRADDSGDGAVLMGVFVRAHPTPAAINNEVARIGLLNSILPTTPVLRVAWGRS